MSAVQRERLDAQLRGVGVGSEQSVGEIRENFVKLMDALPVPAGARVQETSLGGRPALRVSPDAGDADAEAEASAGILLYLHGGSHVVGSPWTALGLTAGLVLRTGIPGISLDYRLARSTRSRPTSRTWSRPTGNSSSRGTRPGPSPGPVTPPAVG